MSSYDLVRFGAPQWVGGISHYEVQQLGGTKGDVWRSSTGQWFGRRIGEKRCGPFKTRKAACEAML